MTASLDMNLVGTDVTLTEFVPPKVYGSVVGQSTRISMPADCVSRSGIFPVVEGEERRVSIEATYCTDKYRVRCRMDLEFVFSAVIVEGDIAIIHGIAKSLESKAVPC